MPKPRLLPQTEGYCPKPRSILPNQGLIAPRPILPQTQAYIAPNQGLYCPKPRPILPQTEVYIAPNQSLNYPKPRPPILPRSTNQYMPPNQTIFADQIPKIILPPNPKPKPILPPNINIAPNQGQTKAICPQGLILPPPSQGGFSILPPNQAYIGPNQGLYCPKPSLYCPKPKRPIFTPNQGLYCPKPRPILPKPRPTLPQPASLSRLPDLPCVSLLPVMSRPLYTETFFRSPMTTFKGSRLSIIAISITPTFERQSLPDSRYMLAKTLLKL
nr:extensin-like [Penaeus vannamei]